ALFGGHSFSNTTGHTFGCRCQSRSDPFGAHALTVSCQGSRYAERLCVAGHACWFARSRTVPCTAPPLGWEDQVGPRRNSKEAPVRSTTLTSSATIPLDTKSAEEHLMRFLRVEGLSGQEKAIGEAVVDELKKVGVPVSAIRFDNVYERIPAPTQTGNLFVDLPGTRPGSRLVFAAHLDTVQMCAGAKPSRKGDRIVSDGSTALGGDNRTGCAVLVSLAETLLKHKLPHPPISLMFLVREESGIQGARYMAKADLKGATMCFNFDSKLVGELITGAVGQENWDVEIKGKAAHAGLAPEKGISSTLVAAIALAEARRAGWFGNVVKAEGKGTSNVGG